MTCIFYKIFPIYSDEVVGTKSGKSCIKRVYPFKERSKIWLTTNKRMADRKNMLDSILKAR